VAAAVLKGLTYGKRTRNRAEISQLGTAMAQFYQRYGVYPPSRLMLCEKYQYYLNPPTPGGTPVAGLPAHSVAFLTKMFANIDITYWTNVGMNWNGNKDPITGADLIAPNPVEPSPYVVLEGDQVLVFCLGGIPAWSAVSIPPPAISPPPPNCVGFSANPKNPAFRGSP